MMIKVGVAQLKARLSEYLRLVRGGQEVVVLDRRSPVARLIPYGEGGGEQHRLQVREPLKRYGMLRDVPLPPPVELDVDIVELLMEERQPGR